MLSRRKRRRESFARLLRGHGLEIGALSDPLPTPFATSVAYSDWLSGQQLEQLHPGSTKPDIISDSESFPTIADAAFDFVVANHVLEHLTDPIGALLEWHRILRIGGLLMLTLPDKRFTFDAPRERTSLEHLVSDHQSTDVPEIRNRCHLEDWATHVERLPPGSARRTQWIEEQLRRGYTVHNHVWIPVDIVRLISWMNANRLTNWWPERVANTSPLTNEFIFLLRRTEERPDAASRLDALRRRLAMSDPLITILGAAKGLVRGTRASGPRMSQ